MRKKRQEEEEAVGPTGMASPRITPVDIQQKEFRLAFRGYNERDVDAFLDEITEELALYVEENRRLREGATEARAAGAGTTSAPGSPGGVAPFLNAEREFLQSLAGLVQGHAETVREMVKAHRERTSAAAISEPVRVPDAPEDTSGAISDAPAVVVPESTKAAVAASDAAEDAAAPIEGSHPARSLRELFWGED